VIKVRVNGQEREIPEGLTIVAMLGHLQLPGERIAIERNFDILPRASWQATVVQANDSFEIVHFVGGG
jgi:sulfur carrier protein